MPKVRGNGIEIEYESFGRDGDPAIALIMGFAAQLTMWPTALCEARRQLALAENSEGNEGEAWRLANECLRFLKLGDDAALQRLGLSVEQCFDALEFLPQYLRFRAEFPLARIWDPDNSEAFSKARNLEAQKLLGAYLAIPFGCGYRQLSEHDPNLSRFFDAIRQPLRWCSKICRNASGWGG